MATTIKKCFQEIDQLQDAAFAVIDSISSGNYYLETLDSLEQARTEKVKVAQGLIRQIPDFLCVVEVALKNSNQLSCEFPLLAEKYELYGLKEAALKESLRTAQLKAYKQENQIIHQQRLAKYGCDVDHMTLEEKLQPSTLLAGSADLFAGRSTKTLVIKDGKSVKDQITIQNNNITSSLKQTRQLMTMSVMQTELNIDSLDQQYKDLLKFSSKLVDMETILVKSRQIVKFIERQDKQDKRRIYMAVGFLVLCSAWVLWRRALKTPVRILLWTMVKTFGAFSWAVSKTSPENVGSVSVSGSVLGPVSVSDSIVGSDSVSIYLDTSPLIQSSLSTSQILVSLPLDQDSTESPEFLVWDPDHTESLSSNYFTTPCSTLDHSSTTINAQKEVIVDGEETVEEKETVDADAQNTTVEQEIATEKEENGDIVVEEEIAAENLPTYFEEPGVSLTEKVLGYSQSHLVEDVALDEVHNFDQLATMDLANSVSETDESVESLSVEQQESFSEEVSEEVSSETKETGEIIESESVSSIEPSIIEKTVESSSWVLEAAVDRNPLGPESPLEPGNFYGAPESPNPKQDEHDEL